jgi:hypothetical protein
MFRNEWTFYVQALLVLWGVLVVIFIVAIPVSLYKTRKETREAERQRVLARGQGTDPQEG